MLGSLVQEFKQRFNKNNSKKEPLSKELSLAKGYLKRRGFAEAERLCTSYLEKHVNNEDGLRMLLTIRVYMRKHQDVITLSQKIETLFGADIWSLNKRSNAYSALFMYDDAITTLYTIVELSGRDLRYLVKLARTLSSDALRDDEALIIYEEIIKHKDVKVPHYLSYARCLNYAGQVDKAVEVIRKTLTIGSHPGQSYWELSDLKSFTFCPQDIADMLALDLNSDINASGARSLFYALGKAFEDTQEYDRSFEYYARANTLVNAQKSYDPDWTVNQFSWMTKYFKSIQYGKSPNSYRDTGPIFIVGMHRSGSTLVEQILASHSMVDGTKELSLIIDIAEKLANSSEQIGAKASHYPSALMQLSSPELEKLGNDYIEKTRGLRKNAPIFIDKMPANYYHIGLILSILPNAKIIDARRQPLSVGVSIFRQNLGGGHTSSLYNIGHYYQYYVKMMRFWHTVFPGQIHRIQYEDMVTNPEIEIRRLLEFCNLPFEESCLNFHKTERSVKTPSANQVRQPIYSSSVEQWKHYEHHLRSLKQGLGDILYSYDVDKSEAAQ